MPTDRNILRYELGTRERQVNESVTIQPADSRDAQAIANMWESAGRWLAERGIDQWQHPASSEKITRDIERGTAYIAHTYEDKIGTITVDGSVDPEFWAKEHESEEALYVHRIIVRPDMRGKDLGATLLDWASKKAEKAGKAWIRVYTWKTNSELGRYYERQGFVHVRTVDLPHGRSSALYQRPAGIVTGHGPRYVGLESMVRDDRGYLRDDLWDSF